MKSNKADSTRHNRVWMRGVGTVELYGGNTVDKVYLFQRLDLSQIQDRVGQPIWMGEKGKENIGVVGKRDDQRFTVHFLYGWEWLEDVWAIYGERGIFGLTYVSASSIVATAHEGSDGMAVEPAPWSLNGILSRMLQTAESQQPVQRSAVYIAGKINCDDEHRERFKRAQIRLEADGYTIMDPDMLPSGPHESFYPVNQALIDASDVVFFLDDWHQSISTQAEMLYTLENGKQVIVGH